MFITSSGINTQLDLAVQNQAHAIVHMDQSESIKLIGVHIAPNGSPRHHQALGTT